MARKRPDAHPVGSDASGPFLLRRRFGDGVPNPLRLIFLFGLFLGSDLSKTRKILGFYLCRFAVFTANGIINFLAMDADLFGGIDPQTHLVAADINHGDLDVVSDHDRLVALTGQHQHTGSFLGKGPGSEIPNPRRREFQLARHRAGTSLYAADALPWCETGRWA